MKIPDAGKLETATLHQTELDKPLTGANVKFRAEDDKGTKVTFKPFETWTTNFERDEFAQKLRSEAGEVTIPVIAQKLTLANGKTVEGYVKPRFKSDDMPTEVVNWNPTERGELLADSAWAEFLGNYDLKLDQYKEVTTDQGKQVVDVDWDCSLQDYEDPTKLDRFKLMATGIAKHLFPAAPTSQSLLFEDYVHGKTDLDFTPLFDAVGRIENLSEAQLREAIKPFTDKQFANGGTFGAYKTSDELVAAVVGRQKNLRAEFTGFVGELKAEREFQASREGKLPDLQQVKTFVKEKWQHLGNWFVKSPFLAMTNHWSQHQAAKRLGIDG
jgi:hypothetical protein